LENKFADRTGLSQVRHNPPAEAVHHGRLFAFLIVAWSRNFPQLRTESFAPQDDSARTRLMHDFDIFNLWPVLLAAIVLGAGMALLSGGY
jgi:hypothetical protein